MTDAENEYIELRAGALAQLIDEDPFYVDEQLRKLRAVIFHARQTRNTLPLSKALTILDDLYPKNKPDDC